MGWGYRKSVRISKGTRLNFSKSGIGFSTGVKGFRVGTGPKGSYVRIGLNGVFYQGKLGGSTRKASPSSPPRSPQAPPNGYGTDPIHTAEAEDLVDQTATQHLSLINESVGKPSYFNLVGILIAVLTLVWLTVMPIVGVIFLALGACFLVYLNQFETKLRTHQLQYQLDPVQSGRWDRMGEAFVFIARSNRLWRIDSQGSVYDWKRQAGASTTILRSIASIQFEQPPFLATNLRPTCLKVGSQTLAFLPDRLYVYGGKNYGSVAYSDLKVEASHLQYIESEAPPSDGNQVAQTWQYVNKDGSPDRRFNNNRQFPIFQYGLIQFSSSTGLNIVLMTSSSNAAHQFVSAFRQSQSGTGQSHTQAPPKATPPPKSSSKTSMPVPSSCYKILGLNTGCSRDEAAAKYRSMAKAYHPDLVAHLAPEFQKVAKDKMVEINRAYSELKALRGW